MKATPIHDILVKAFEREERAYLWVPSDTITFVPRVLPKVYGDGRALFALATINQRPAYWIIRACSQTEFGEFGDDVLTDLEEAFGNGRCGYSGISLFQEREERMRYCKCDECSDGFVAQWPMVDGDGGYSWGRVQWPKELASDNDGYRLADAAIAVQQRQGGAP